jgi:ketosteroid isomerase-like protein
MNEQELIQLVKRGYERFKAGDIAGLLPDFADDIEWVVPDTPGVPFAGTWRGKQEFLEYAKKFHDSMRAAHFEPREFIAQGNKVVVLGHFSGEAKTTGRPLENEWVNVFTYKDDKLTHFQHYGDTAASQAAFASAPIGPRDAGASVHH